MYVAKPNDAATLSNNVTQGISFYVCLIGLCIFWMAKESGHWYEKYQAIPFMLLLSSGVILLFMNCNYFVRFFIENDFVRVLAGVSITGIALTTILFLHSYTIQKE